MQPFIPVYVAAPPFRLDQHKRQVFEELFTRAKAEPHTPLAYTAPYPKYEFLTYLVNHHPVLVHGSNNCAIAVFAPRRQTDYAGRWIEAVFAASDGIWPMFFATVHRKPYPWLLRNGCQRITESTGHSYKQYHFSISRTLYHDHPWTDGMIYILPRESFKQIEDESGALTEEWASPVPVQPLARLAITPQDFPFMAAVQSHDDP